MTGIGTLANASAIVAGAAVGVVLGRSLPERFKSIATQAVGLSVMLVGASGALQGILVPAPAGATMGRRDLMLVILCLVVGGVLGEALRIEARLERLGEWVQGRMGRGGGGFAEGFASTSLLFCVGAMAVVGALEDGLAGDPSTLYAKAVLDGVLSVIFGASMGVGVAFSSLSVLVYQGGITLLAGTVKHWLTPQVIGHISTVGSVLILAIGINLLGSRRVRVGNLLPAAFAPLAWHLVSGSLGL